MTRRPFEVVAFDADDTLWHSEDGFRRCEEQFGALLEPYAPPGVDVMAALTAVERQNLHVYGYGVKAFALSMVEAAVSISRGEVPATVIAQIVEMGRELLLAPVSLLDGVPEVLAAVGDHYRVVLITKGDLIHQTRKVTTSGLAHHFEHVEIVLEKDADTYARVLRELAVSPDRFCMVGNSVKSDILPVVALGGTGVHVPYPLLWELEHVDPAHVAFDDATFAELGSLRDLPDWLAAHTTG
jgi:putative hydrolase of the HAD superfamily